MSRSHYCPYSKHLPPLLPQSLPRPSPLPPTIPHDPPFLPSFFLSFLLPYSLALSVYFARTWRETSATREIRPAQRAAHGTARRGAHGQCLIHAQTRSRVRGTSNAPPRTRHHAGRAHGAEHAAPYASTAHLARQHARGAFCTAPRWHAARRASNFALRARHARARESSTAQHRARVIRHAVPQFQRRLHKRWCVQGTARAAPRRNAARSAPNARRRANGTARAAPRTRHRTQRKCPT